MLILLFFISLAYADDNGRLLLKSQPKTVDIYIDGQFVQTGTPFVPALSPGEHIIEIKKPGKKTYVLQLMVEPNQFIQQEVILEDIAFDWQEKLHYQKDAFETQAEFLQRLTALKQDIENNSQQRNPAYQLGTAYLIKSDYSIKNMTFPITIQWTENIDFLQLPSQGYIIIALEKAKKLWEEGEEKPIFLSMDLQDNSLLIKNYYLLGLEQEWIIFLDKNPKLEDFLKQEQKLIQEPDNLLALAELYNLEYQTSKNTYWQNKAMITYEILAKQNNIIAQITLGKLYFDLNMLEKAAFWWVEASLQEEDKVKAYLQKISRDIVKDFYIKHPDNLIAQRWLANYYSGKDWSQAFFWYQKAAEQQDINAEFYIAEAYAKGIGVKANLEQAFIWYQKAALQGHVFAQLELAIAYRDGLGINRDVNKALYWLDKASEIQGNKATLLKQGILKQDNILAACNNNQQALYNIAQYYFEVAEEKTDATAYQFYHMVTHYYPHPDFFTKAQDKKYQLTKKNLFANRKINEEEQQQAIQAAKNLYLQELQALIDRGEKLAIRCLAEAYFTGTGDLDINYLLAKQLFEQVEDSIAWYRLGFIYEKGLGIEKDSDKAIQYYEKAKDYPNAILQLANIYWYEHTDKAIALLEGSEFADLLLDIKAYKFLVEQAQDSEAQFKLAKFYQQEQHKNDEKAKYWYQQAAKQGHAMAQQALGELYFKENNPEQAVFWLLQAELQAIDQPLLDKMQKTNREIVVNAYIKQADNFLQAKQWLAEYYKNQNNAQKAIDWYQKMQTLTAENLYALAQQYEKIEDNQQAFQYYQQAAQAQYAPAQLQLALLYKKQKQLDKAKYWLEQVQSIPQANIELEKINIIMHILAAEAGDGEAIIFLSTKLFNRANLLHSSKNYIGAYKWYFLVKNHYPGKEARLAANRMKDLVKTNFLGQAKVSANEAYGAAQDGIMWKMEILKEYQKD